VSVVNFTPISALIGGALIGLSAAGAWWLLGRLAGVSNILGSAVTDKEGRDWRIAFLCGLLAAGVLALALLAGEAPFQLDAGYGQVVLAGLLVGFGTQLGSGCTSGHGICGISRLSLRSVVATLVFMAAGVVTVYVVQHLIA
jgi:uncharacterized membrane protein YedE/YeeE